MDWNNTIKEALEKSGLKEWIDDFVEHNKDDIENIEEYLGDLVRKAVTGERAGLGDFKALTKPSDKLRAARGLIKKAIEDKRKYKEFQNSLGEAVSFIVKTAVKTIL